MNINELPLLSTIGTTDLIPIWSNTLGGTAAVSFNTLITSLVQEIYAKQDFNSQYITATSGGSVSITDKQQNIFAILLGSGTLSTFTLTLPPASNTLDGQTVMVFTVPGVTTFTLGLNGALGANIPTSLSNNATFTMRYDAGLNTWYRVN